MSKEDYSQEKYALIEEPLKRKETKVWHGRYKGLRYEINTLNNLKVFNGYHPEAWAYYVYIDLEQVSGEFEKDLWLEPIAYKYREDAAARIVYDYYKSRVSSNVDWHGGVTWYSKVRGLEHEEQPRTVKFGCDFQHLYDEGETYDLEGVARECKQTISQLVSLFGEIKYVTCGDGKYRKKSELTNPTKDEK